MVDHLMEIKSACTPEQFQKFKELWSIRNAE